jgi:hypothetical protein
MAVSRTLQNSINFIRPYLKNQPVSVTVSEPGLSAGNTVLEILLAPPLKWRWNRRQFQFNTIANPPTWDYMMPLPDFGFMENQWLVDKTGKAHSVTGDTSLSVDAQLGRPTIIAPQYDDNLGNITFRLRNTPNDVYTVFGDYQRKPRLMQSYADPWDVAPDEFSHCYDLGFLTFMSLLVNDSRFPVFERWFLSRVLAMQEGLDDQARDIFLGNWMSNVKTVTRTQAGAQTGNAARGT